MVGWKTYAAYFASSALAACGAVSGGQYDGRDGAAEALADLNGGKPLMIFSHRENTVTPGWASPGLVACSPDQARGDDNLRVFRVIDEAASEEGETRTFTQDWLASSAVRFARAYNLTAFRLRRPEVENVCPGVRTG